MAPEKTPQKKTTTTTWGKKTTTTTSPRQSTTPTTTPPPPQIDPGLAAIFASAAPSGSGSSSDQDLAGLQVYAGKRTKNTSKWKAGDAYYQSAADLYRSFFNRKLNDRYVLAVQERFYAAGLYGTGDRGEVAWGHARDPMTLKLYKALLVDSHDAQAMGYLVTPRGLLDEYAANAALNARGGSGGGGSAPIQPIRLTSPDDIMAVIDKTAPEVIGRNLSADEKQKLVQAYQSAETGYQRAVYAGGTAAEAPNLGTFAEQEARRLHPEEADTFEKFTRVNDVMGLLFGGSRG